jgi:Icc-related predicted phosphoesterase
MLAISDVHHALVPLRRLIALGEPVLILGDLVNLTDYRTGEGAIADVLGVDFANDVGRARAAGDFRRMRDIWMAAMGEGAKTIQDSIREALERQYREVAEALAGGSGYALHGNVDRPAMLRESLPPGIEYVHAESRTIGGRVFGFAGGGVATPVGAQGEVSDDDMNDILESLGPVDVLCTHVPPAVDPLRTDVVTGRSERGSQPILDYILAHQPSLHLFGDVHQPQASTWRIGRTVCRNVGYFRATGRGLVI